MSEHSVVKTEMNLNYTMMETKKEHRNSAFASSKQTLEELSVQIELLQEVVEVSTALQQVEQLNLFLLTPFFAGILLLEERNKCIELDKSYGFVHEQQFALEDDWNEGGMYQKLFHVAMKHETFVDGNAIPKVNYKP